MVAPSPAAAASAALRLSAAPNLRSALRRAATILTTNPRPISILASRPYSSSYPSPPSTRPSSARPTALPSSSSSSRPRPSISSFDHHHHHHHRTLHSTAQSGRQRQRKPIAHNREPVPDQPPPTDFGTLDVLAGVAVPATAVTACHDDGFALNSGARIRGGDGALLVAGEAFAWRPWLVTNKQDGNEGGDDKGGSKRGRGERRGLVNAKGQWEVGEEVFGLLGVLWPRPDLLILGVGPQIRPLSPATRRAISNLGMRIEVLDTWNAASQYNMLATERGVEDVAAALIPIGWKEGGE